MNAFRLAMLILVTANAAVTAGDWPQWRGPQRTAVANETQLLDAWTYPPPVVWRADSLGEGYASVAVSQGRVFTLSRRGPEVHCVALDDRTGRQLWSQKIGESQRHAMSTPTVTSGLVYALDPDGELVCLQAHDGAVVWHKDLFQEFSGQLMSGRGYGESPLVDGDHVICTPGGPQAMLVALHRRTSELIWKATLPPFGEKGRDGAAFSSAVVTEAAGRRQIVQLTGRGLVGIEAKSGQFLWGYNDICNTTVNIPTPIVREDYVFSANGYNAGSVLLKLEPGGETGVVAKEVYRLRGTDFQNHHGGVVLLGDHLFGGHGSNNGLPTCLEFLTGKVSWKRRGPGTGSAAIAAADGHLVFRYQNGVVAWIAAHPEGYQLQGTFEIPGTAGDSWSHPVIANGRLYLREQSSLWVHDLINPGSADRPLPPPATLSNLPPEFAALKQLGASIEPIPFEDKAWQLLPERRRMYRFANPDRENGAMHHLLVTISDDHLTETGELLPDVHAALRQLPGSPVLAVGETRLSDAGLQQVAELDSLVGLNVELCSRLTDEGFACLAQADRLRLIMAMGTAVSVEGLKAWGKLPHLVAVDLEVCDHVTDESCRVLATCLSLRALNLKKTAFEPTRITPAGLTQLPKLTRLESLNLYGNDVTDEALQSISQLKQLRELDLSLVGITDQGLQQLTALSDLKRLSLLYSVGFAGPMITDASVGPLIKLEKLQWLNLTGAKITDRGLQRLSDHKSLRNLELARTSVTAAGIQEFRTHAPKCRVSPEAPAADGSAR